MHRIEGFTSREAAELLASWLAISFCFSVYGLNRGFEFFLAIFAASLMTAGLGFLFHELMHRFTARRFGCLAEYRMWLWGLLLALIVALISRGQLVFAAPGAVYITPLIVAPYVSERYVKKAYGLISLSGPIANIILAAVFFAVLSFGAGGFLYIAARIGVMVNLWLASFNMLPVPPLDGSKVFRWSPIVWGSTAIPVWAALLLLNL